MARLYIRQDGQEQVFEIQDDLVTFGRSSENSIQVRDYKSSRKHCQIERTPAGFKLVDLESANGTSVNGAKVNHQMLEEGDVIAIGQVEIQFGEKPPALVGAPEAAPTPAAAAVEDITGTPEAASVFAPEAPTPMPSSKPRLEVVRRPMANPWIGRAVAAAVLLVVGLVGQNMYHEYQLGQAAENDYVALMDGLRGGSDADALPKLKEYLAQYPGSPHLAAIRDRADQIQATLTRMETASADFKTLKARADEMSGDLESMLEDFRVLLAKNQGTPLAERIKAEIRALDTRISRHGQDALNEVEKQAAELLADEKYGAAADLYKQFSALHAGEDLAKKADDRLAQILRDAYDSFDKLVAKANTLLEQSKYDEAAELVRSRLSCYAGTLPYYQGQLKLLGIEVLAKGASQDKDDQKLLTLRNECFQLAVKADDLAKLRRFSDARKVYDQILAKLAAPELATLNGTFAARAKGVLSEAGLFGKLIKTINDKAIAPDTYALSSDFNGKIERADEQAMDVRFPKGFTRVAWLALKPAEMLELYARLAPKGDDLFTLGVYCYQHHLDKDAAKLLNDFAVAAPDRKPEVDRCVARARGIEVPAGGFIYHNQAYLTPDEHKYALLGDQVNAIVMHLDRTDPKDVDKAFAEFQELYKNNDLRSDFREQAKARVVAAFEAKRDNGAKKLAKLPAVLKRDQLKKLKEDLNNRRKAALELIYDEKVYTYDQAKNDHGAKAQPDVDKLVAAVRELWDHPMDVVVALDKSIQKQIQDIEDADKMVVSLGGKSAIGSDSEYADMMASINEQMDLRSICLNSTERQILEHNKRVRAFNATVEAGMTQDEMRQIEINNDYREMMGRKILEAHKLLGQAARKHSEWMVTSGVFSHDEDAPDRKTPGDRCRKEGYSGPCGENICAGAGDPKTAFDMWYHSSGHHRNMLSDMWNHLGVGRKDNHWTQDFGQGPGQSQNTDPNAAKTPPGDKKGGGKSDHPTGNGSSGGGKSDHPTGNGSKSGATGTGGSTPGSSTTGGAATGGGSG